MGGNPRKVSEKEGIASFMPPQKSAEYLNSQILCATNEGSTCRRYQLSDQLPFVEQMLRAGTRIESRMKRPSRLRVLAGRWMEDSRQSNYNSIIGLSKALSYS